MRFQVNMGVACKEMGDHDEAMECYNGALDIYIKVFGHNHLDVAATKEKYLSPLDSFSFRQSSPL